MSPVVMTKLMERQKWKSCPAGQGLTASEHDEAAFSAKDKRLVVVHPTAPLCEMPTASREEVLGIEDGQ